MTRDLWDRWAIVAMYFVVSGTLTLYLVLNALDLSQIILELLGPWKVVGKLFIGTFVFGVNLLLVHYLIHRATEAFSELDGILSGCARGTASRSAVRSV